jgi:hypothetical protein
MVNQTNFKVLEKALAGSKKSESGSSNSKESDNELKSDEMENQDNDEGSSQIEYSDVKSEGVVKVYNELSRVNDNINNRVEIARRAAREEFLLEQRKENEAVLGQNDKNSSRRHRVGKNASSYIFRTSSSNLN